jgi:putative copper export protein
MVWVTAEVVGILMRWAHLASAAVLIGGLIYARLVVAPMVVESSPEERAEALDGLGNRFRPLVYAAIAGLVVSGLYNFLLHRGHTPYYHAWFGVKVLLALHVFAAAVLAVRSSRAPGEEEARRLRRMSGAILSGLLVILIAAYLRLIY